MKFRLLTILSAAILLLALAGCAAMEPDRTAAGENIVRSAAAATPTLPAAVPTEPAPVRETGAILSRNEVERIALEHAGFTADQVERLHIEFEIDDGLRQYDVRFYQDRREYEFEIDAETGKILSYDIDTILD